MSFLKHTLVGAVVVIGASVWAGCTSADDGADSGGQDITGGGCKVTAPHLGRDLTADEISKLGDPIAKRVLLGGCPQKLDGILQSLNKAADCKQSKITTRVVSDRSLLLDKADEYRAVLTQDCQGGTDHDAFVSIFGVDPSDGQLPQEGIEVIGHDQTSGVFNFYVNEKGNWRFMGSSKDAVADGYDCGKNGDCEPKSANKARCWACHESGGINMKELNSPWHSWSNTPIHSDEVFKKFKALGQEEDGINQERRTEGANSEWAKTRVKILKEKGTAEVLRPLFCTMTFNLQATGSADVGDVPAEFFVDSSQGPEIGFTDYGFNGNGVNFDAKVYAAQIAANGQKVVDGSGKQLSAKGKPLTGSPSGMIFPKKGDVDRRYVAELIAQKIIDKDFVQDVLNVDFTRPIFSPDRCALVDKAPKLSGADLTAEKIREGFKKSLAGDSSDAAKTLLKNLGDTNDGAAHQKEVDDFFTKCQARPAADLVKDILQYNAHLRAAAKAHRTRTPDGVNGIIEFNETLPVDNLSDTSKSFDPATCELK